ncbi:ABC transporter ATP-binding protein [Streptomyces sp. DSM 41982]|uniref:ABC transporter ATP-binding protein n=1 Tax=Streptomyces evansiae TaxID=3075535 RepID=A0ABD5E5X0_9ACTN|nr:MULTISPECIES: ABC transporter ATP-binding protein [unclassified Streptomyces]MDT0416763.1 ABC transporter ATP-binding protein [Streptomyces sp. DSM 41982]
MDLGLRAHDGWTLRHCDFEVPRGRIAGLVGPNGDGKTSLLALAAGLSDPAEGTLRVLGHRPGSREVLPRVGVLLQDRPLHGSFTVAETLRLGRELNPGWDEVEASALVRESDIPPRERVSRLSGGQRTCLALALALGKRPDLLLLDEPMADLDPLRRHTMMAALMRTAAEHGTTVVMSSHILAELHLVCDYVLLMARGRMLIADDTDFVQAAHTLVTYTRDAPDAEPLRPFGPDGATVVETRLSGRSAAALLRLPTSLPAAVRTTPPALDEILLAYLRSPDATPLLAPAGPPAATAQRQSGPSRSTADGSGA